MNLPLQFLIDKAICSVLDKSVVNFINFNYVYFLNISLILHLNYSAINKYLNVIFVIHVYTHIFSIIITTQKLFILTI